MRYYQCDVKGQLGNTQLSLSMEGSIPIQIKGTPVTPVKPSAQSLRIEPTAVLTSHTIPIVRNATAQGINFPPFRYLSSLAVANIGVFN